MNLGARVGGLRERFGNVDEFGLIRISDRDGFHGNGYSW